MKTDRCQSRSLWSPAMKAVAVAAAMGAAGAALAAENGLQRYSPGVGGSDMTAPLVPGWYGQMPLVVYHASKIKDNSGDAKVQSGSTTVTVIVSDGIDTNSTSFLLTVLADSDHDGIPDVYELAHGMNPNDPTDAAKDFDGDGHIGLR